MERAKIVATIDAKYLMASIFEIDGKLLVVRHFELRSAKNGRVELVLVIAEPSFVVKVKNYEKS